MLGNSLLGSGPKHRFWELVIEDFKQPRNYDQVYRSLLGLPFNTFRTTMEEAVYRSWTLNESVFYE